MIQDRRHDPDYTGFAAWRVIVARPATVTTMAFYQGLGSKTGVMPLNDETMYLFHVCPEPGNPWQGAETLVPELRRRLTGYGGVIGEVRDALTDGDEVVYSPIESLRVPPPWNRGRIAIGGDAAHATPPHLTQGAAMALEDAVVLAEELTTTGSVDEQLSRYAKRRYPRSSSVLDFSLGMLRDEQSITTEEQLERARSAMRDELPDRLAQSDVRMDRVVVDPSTFRCARR
jgi:2-polyprenyl-6-methoxyphenol hydroxylase-like FAD-dependent oxidoreductase